MTSKSSAHVVHLLPTPPKTVTPSTQEDVADLASPNPCLTTMKDSDLLDTNLLLATTKITGIDIDLILDLVQDLAPIPDLHKQTVTIAKITTVLQHLPIALVPTVRAEMFHTRMLSPALPKTNPWMILSTHPRIKERAKKYFNK